MQTVQRLYETFQPNHYNLLLTLEREKRAFSGTVVIKGSHSSQHGNITLHAKNLKITSAFVNEKPVEFSLEVNEDALVLKTADVATGGDVQIAIDFSGTITDPMHGLYPCYYTHEGVKKELLATQLESHHAREVFPCVDEPEAKATFDLSLTTETGVTTLANMPVREQNESSGSLVTSFETSPRMSPYLLAFVVGELQSKSVRTKSGVEVTGWATNAQSSESFDFGLDVASRSIDFFEEYFGVPYPLPKADHVALPDFSAAAMENWGLITYRESCFLADGNTAINTKQWIATVIAHETSHQWFGNLVTMKWWDDLWLNESFASLMENVCPEALFPEWDFRGTYINQRVLPALRRDYLPGIQPIKIAVNHPDEISTIFDPSIVYAKGARSLFMLRAYIGEDAFKAGLSQYFKDHAYKNTVGDDLWKSLSDASGKDINAFMKPWLEQPGMPVVHVTRDGGEIILSQKRFVIPLAEEDTLWPIPLHGIPDELPKLLDTKQTRIPAPSNDSFILVNHDATTHAIVSYDEQLRTQLENSLANNRLEEIDRLSLLHDMSLLARAGEQTAVSLLKLIGQYAHETSEPVWDIIALVIADIRRLVEHDEEAEKALKGLVRELALPTYQRLGWTQAAGEKESDTKLRAVVIGLLGYSEYEEVIAKSLEAFGAVSSAQDLPGELRSTILALVVKHGSAADIEQLIKEHRTTSSSDLQDDITAGLTATKDKVLIERFINTFTDKTFIRPQDLFHWFIYLIRNRHGREMTWTWMTENWAWIEKTYAGDKSYDNFVRYSASALGTHEWLRRYEAFFDDKRSITALARAIELGVADITVRADWFDRDAESLCEALRSEATN